MDEREKRRRRILEAYAKEGSIKGTRRATGHSIGLIRKVLRGQDQPKPPRTVKRPSKLDPYRPLLTRLILEDQLTAILALKELREVGFDGGYTIVKRAVREIRPTGARKPTTVVEHPPGQEGQMDWSPYWVLFDGERVQVKAFSLVLPFSRWIFVRFAMDETLETLVRLHDEAFSLLGGVPHTMSYDNMTTVGRHIGPGKVWINPRFETWAGEYDFAIKLIDPGQPNQHASVERHFDYVEKNCLKRRRSRFADLEDLNAHAKWWCEEVANVRTHRTLNQRPIDRFRNERTYLMPLPGDRPEAFHTVARKVGTDHCVAIETNRYSVSPRYVGCPATVRVFAQRLEILLDGELHCTHERSSERRGRFVLAEHAEAFKRSAPSKHLLQESFLRLGDGAKTYYDGLVAQRGSGAGYHLKRLLRLADRHGTSPVVAAMAHAARYGAFSADAVGRILSGRGLPATHTEPGEPPMPPERVRRWLEGLEVEGTDLSEFDDRIAEDDDEEA